MPHTAISAPVAASSQPGRESPPPVQLAPVSHNLPTLARYELQARILANQPAEEIAAAMNLPVGLVASFEATEFNVRQSLAHSSFVLHKVIAIPPTEEWSGADVGRLWMWLGYTYGADVRTRRKTLSLGEPNCCTVRSQLASWAGPCCLEKWRITSTGTPTTTLQRT